MNVTRIKSIRNSRKTRVAAYVRVSTLEDNQDESYEMQARYYEKFIRSNPEWDFAGVYGDRVSGTHSENRPAFNRIIEDALAKKIDIIYCKSVSRWARNAVDALETVKYLNGNSVHLVFEQEGIDTRAAGVIFQLAMASSIAESESVSISENLKWLYRHRAERGICLPPRNRYFGFCTDDHKFIPDENAPYVRRMFEMYADGKSADGIAAALNHEGVLTNHGRPFTRGMVMHTLKNEVYVGDYRFGKTTPKNVITGEPDERQVRKYVKDHHEGIVSRSLWEKVQARFEDQRIIKERRVARQRKVVDMVLAEPRVSNGQIAEQLGISAAQVGGIVCALKNSGVLKKSGDGWVVDADKAKKKFGE